MVVDSAGKSLKASGITEIVISSSAAGLGFGVASDSNPGFREESLLPSILQKDLI